MNKEEKERLNKKISNVGFYILELKMGKRHEGRRNKIMKLQAKYDQLILQVKNNK